MTTESQEIVVTETCGIDRIQEFVRIGVPFPKGRHFDKSELQLIAPTGAALPMQSTVLKTWHDGSIKWLLLDFAATVSSYDRAVYHLIQGKGTVQETPNPLIIIKNTENWRIHTGVAEFIIDTRTFLPFKNIILENEDMLNSIGASCILTLDGNDQIPLIDTFVAETEGPLRTILRIGGRFGNGSLATPRFSCRLHFFASCGHTMMEFTLLNPKAASHPGGLWDLGDSGAHLFQKLALQFPLKPQGVKKVLCSPEPGIEYQEFQIKEGGISIQQESSGGGNWNSPVHRTRDGKVHLKFSGYQIYNGNTKISEGKRATPVVWCGNGECGISAVMPYFWQEFPKAFTVDRDRLDIELFPDRSPDLHELQGGEQKTSTIFLDFSSSPDGLAWARSPLLANPSPETCRQSKVFLDLPELPGESTIPDLIDKFISPEDLLKKREIIDEYGWRNFGETYADHEAFFHNEDRLFISHYNNQYDIAAGLYRKFLSTDNFKWGVLAADLIRHVHDIDIYHTCLDREEYNRGLFWHTDHYLDAGLGTHRSNSREHLQKKDPRFCGGGPGAEHCYTSGFLIHYLLTGNPDYKEAVINLAQWSAISLTGPRTILAVIKKSLQYIRLLRSVDKEQPPLFPRYPCTRGTGNTITAALDAFEVTGDRKFLNQTAELIRSSIHPDDDIPARNLLNAELGWSYTVLIGAIAKFIEKKVSLEEFDEDLGYAKSSFLAYAKWMCDNEYPYLEKPDILEYPNETWAAQDLRKSVIFHYASRYGEPDWRERFLERSRFFFETACEQLESRPTSRFTRPIALILQNGWIGSTLDNVEPLALPIAYNERKIHGHPSPKLTIGAVAKRIFSELTCAIKETSIKREMAWLRARLR